jgi:glycosyltransferase involved in cell wall biosynthesis
MSYDVLCLSHLRWDFVYQRPQHLLSRCARDHRVFFVEEPVFGDGEARLATSVRKEGVHVVVPHLPAGLTDGETETVMRALLSGLVRERRLHDLVLWTYTPNMLPFALDLDPIAIVYDCMDQLSAFRGAPARLLERERDLFAVADVVFTGGQSLFEEKRRFHPNTFAFPSSIDKAHFLQARNGLPEPADQAAIPGPRVGYCGVIDERIDLDLVRELAERRPGWQVVMIGPVVKIAESELPRAPNLHYLCGRPYDDLPSYLAGWDVALMPFARNEATRFISPTKTPEYLAAGAPVVSTSIRDVVRPYGERGLVRIADEPADFIAAIEAALVEDAAARLRAADEFLARISWDATWGRMHDLVGEAIDARRHGGRARARPIERSWSAPTAASAAPSKRSEASAATKAASEHG